MKIKFKNFPIISSFLKLVKKIFQFFKNESRKHKSIYEKIQITCIYICALIVLMYSVKNSLGFVPNYFYKIIPFSEQILETNFLKLLSSPEKTFVIYLLLLEFVINKPIVKFSILVKFNVLFLFILEMVENLVICYWDLLFSRELSVFQAGSYLPKSLLFTFFSIYFLVFFFIYLYSYIQAMQGRFPRFPGYFQKITDSVAFWLKIKRINKIN
jgi:hypothetical protein